MALDEIRRRLLQSQAEKDPLFAEEIHHRARTGLVVMGTVMTAAPPAMILAMRTLVAHFPRQPMALRLTACVTVLGVATLLLSRWRGVERHARLVGWLLSVAVAACLIAGTLVRAARDPGLVYVVNAQVAVVILTALVALPLKPLQVLGLGLTVEAVYALISEIMGAGRAGLDLNGIFILMLALLATGVSISAYQQLVETHTSHRRRLRAIEEMADAQCRILRSDNAASMGRLSAALSHELNNPLGALRSALDTLRRGASGDRPASPEVMARLWETAEGSVARIHGIVRRIERFTNLDRAEVMPVDVNALLRDVAEIVRGEFAERVEFELDCEPVPEVEVQPQAISAVLSSLLSKAARANGRLRVTTRAAEPGVCITLPASPAATLDPGFEVHHGRMAAADWSLFGAQQIVRQHGGNIELVEGDGGRVVRILLAATASSQN